MNEYFFKNKTCKNVKKNNIKFNIKIFGMFYAYKIQSNLTLSITKIK